MKKSGPSLISEICAAAEIADELNKLNSADSNLSPQGAIADCKRHGAKDAEADLALAEIEADTPDGKLLRAAFTRLTMATRNFSRGSIIRPERMGSYLGDGAEALARLQIGRASLQLAVVRVLIANEPHLWGDMDSPSAHAAAISKAKGELEEAYARVEQSITLADLTNHPTVSQDREEGKSILTFKITGDQVRLGDGKDIAARLVGWWIEHGSSKKRAA